MKSLLNHRVRLCCILLLLQLSFAQEASFRITPLRPVAELRAEDDLAGSDVENFLAKIRERIPAA